MKIATPVQMREIDRISIDKYGIPGILLMENAALRVAEESLKLLEGTNGRKTAIFAGKGNNGGDAFAVARHLFNRGIDVHVYTLCKAEDLPYDARINRDIISRMGIPEILVTDVDCIDDLSYCDIIIDGIFGTGFRGKAEGLAAAVISLINKSEKPVLSIDVPSGLDSLTGRAEGACIKACRTVALGLPKLGMTIYPGLDMCGEIVVADIGIPAAAVEQAGLKYSLIDRDMVRDIFPARYSDTNKADYGKLLLLTGSAGMTGSGCLAARAAYRSGAGLVYMGVPASLSHIYDQSVTEAVTLSLADDGDGYFNESAADILPEIIADKDAVAIGPGLSTKKGAYGIVAKLVEKAQIPIVIDADGLNAAARDVSLLGRLKTEAVLTPHPGEMSRLTGMTIKEVQQDRIGCASGFSAKWGVIVVLKGARTVIALPDGRVFINTTGNSGMAAGGTGDVLTGVIASLIGQGIDPSNAAVAGVFLHGLAGDLAAAELGEHGVIAGDIAERLPYAIKQVIGC